MTPTASEGAEQEKESGVPSHAPSVAGSVIEASDGLGGTNYIRIQNMASTGMFLHSNVCVVYCRQGQDSVRWIHCVPRCAQVKFHTHAFSLFSC
jgi:hypothetical protein